LNLKTKISSSSVATKESTKILKGHKLFSFLQGILICQEQLKELCIKLFSSGISKYP